MKTSLRTLAVILLVILEHTPEIHSIRCYKCIIAPYVFYVPGERMCKDFDYSEKFIVDCPNSTVCMKKVTYAKIIGQINGTERDCPHQTLNTQIYTNRTWHAVSRIIEAFEEGCHKIDDKGFRTSSIEHCYCKGDLCNGAKKVTFGSVFCGFLVWGSVIRTLMF